MFTQKLKVLPNGLILSGNVTIAVDTSRGGLVAAGSIKAGLSEWLSRSEEINATAMIDKKYLVSANLHPRTRVQFGYVHLTLTSVGKKAAVQIQVIGPNVNVKGTGYLDTTGEFVHFVSAHLTGSVMGHDGLVIDVVADDAK